AFGVRGLGFLLGRGQLRGSVFLAVESDLGDAYRGKRLAMAKDLLVLLLALEVEDQDLVPAPSFHHLAADHGALALADLAHLTGNRKHIVELDGIAFTGGQLL